MDELSGISAFSYSLDEAEAYLKKFVSRNGKKWWEVFVAWVFARKLQERDSIYVSLGIPSERNHRHLVAAGIKTGPTLDMLLADSAQILDRDYDIILADRRCPAEPGLFLKLQITRFVPSRPNGFFNLLDGKMLAQYDQLLALVINIEDNLLTEEKELRAYFVRQGAVPYGGGVYMLGKPGRTARGLNCSMIYPCAQDWGTVSMPAWFPF